MFAVILSASSAFAKDELTNSYPIEVIEVKGGDTLKVRIHQLYPPLKTKGVLSRKFL